MPHLGTFTGRDRHRDHTEDGSERRHEDRTDTAPTRHLDSLIKLVATLTHEVDIVHEHDTVLDDDTHQKHQTEGTNHIQRTAGEPKGDDNTREGKRNREHDDRRHTERLKLRRHDDIHKHDNHQTEKDHVAERVLLGLDITADMGGVTYRDVKLRDDLRLNRFRKFAKGSVVRRSLDGDDTLTRLTLDGRRCPVLTDGSYFGQFDGLAGSSWDGEVEDIRDRVAVILLKTHDDIVLRAVLLEVTAGHTRYAVTEVGGESSRGEPQTGGFLLIDGDLNIRTVVLTADIHVAGTGQLGNQLTALFRQLGGLIEIITVDLQVHCVTATGSAGRNSTLVLVDFRVFRHLLTENLCKSPDVAVTLPFLRQTDGHLDLVVHRGREERSDRGIVAGTGGGADQLDLRNEFHKPCLQLTCGLEGLFDTRTALQFDGYGEMAVILLLHKVRTDLPHERRSEREAEESQKDKEGDEFMIEAPS